MIHITIRVNHTTKHIELFPHEPVKMIKMTVDETEVVIRALIDKLNELKSGIARVS